jgi:hypothetical protein
MLGELVKTEILAMEHEKECHCPGCAVNKSIRAINVYIAQNHCECPVCSLTREMLATQVKKLKDLLDDHRRLEDDIDRTASSPLYTPGEEYKDRVGYFLEQRGALIALSMALTGSVARFIALCEAAHEAYEIVEASAIRAKVSVLTRDEIQHTQHTLDDLIDRTRDPHDVN